MAETYIDNFFSAIVDTEGNVVSVLYVSQDLISCDTEFLFESYSSVANSNSSLILVDNYEEFFHMNLFGNLSDFRSNKEDNLNEFFEQTMCSIHSRILDHSMSFVVYTNDYDCDLYDTPAAVLAFDNSYIWSFYEQGNMTLVEFESFAGEIVSFNKKFKDTVTSDCNFTKIDCQL